MKKVVLVGQPSFFNSIYKKSLTGLGVEVFMLNFSQLEKTQFSDDYFDMVVTSCLGPVASLKWSSAFQNFVEKKAKSRVVLIDSFKAISFEPMRVVPRLAWIKTPSFLNINSVTKFFELILNSKSDERLQVGNLVFNPKDWMRVYGVSNTELITLTLEESLIIKNMIEKLHFSQSWEQIKNNVGLELGYPMSSTQLGFCILSIKQKLKDWSFDFPDMSSRQVCLKSRYPWAKSDELDWKFASVDQNRAKFETSKLVNRLDGLLENLTENLEQSSVKASSHALGHICDLVMLHSYPLFLKGHKIRRELGQNKVFLKNTASDISLFIDDVRGLFVEQKRLYEQRAKIS